MWLRNVLSIILILCYYSCSSRLEGLSDISSCVFVAVVSVQDEDGVWFDSILLFVPVFSNVHFKVYSWFLESRFLSTAELNT